MTATALPAEAKTSGDAAGWLIAAVVAAFVSIMATALSPDPLFRLQGYIFTIAFVLAGFALNAGVASGGFNADPHRYYDGVIKAGVIATMFWAAVGMLVGVLIAAQLSWPNIFYFPEAGWLNFGRLRPLHTSGVIFAFGGSVLFATSL
jgi:cytochrome c oxidase cbb3-type subunit 1